MDDIWTEALDEAERKTYGWKTVNSTCACCAHFQSIGIRFGFCRLWSTAVRKVQACDEFEEA